MPPAHPRALRCEYQVDPIGLGTREPRLFWKLHDAMFADQQNLSVEGLKGMAATIAGLDGEAFNECLDSDRHAEQVEQDFQDGAKAGVSGTPAFFVNGRFLSGAATLETFAEVIDDELKRTGESKR